MKLQILVPHYKENAEVIKPLLDSLAIQQNVDFSEIGVIICHDGDEAKDFDEAKRIYEDMDGAEPYDDDLGDWRLDYIMREDGETIEY